MKMSISLSRKSDSEHVVNYNKGFNLIIVVGFLRLGGLGYGFLAHRV